MPAALLLALLAPPPPPQLFLPPSGLGPQELAVVINTRDPQSVAVASYYIAKRGIPFANVASVAFDPAPPGGAMPLGEFLRVHAEVSARLSPRVQAFALTWTEPHRVECMGMTSAWAFGYDPRWCNGRDPGACRPTQRSPFYDSPSHLPWLAHRLRPAMMLAGRDVVAVRALIDRGVASDGTLPAGEGWFVRTTDRARNVRWPDFQAAVQRWAAMPGLALRYVDNAAGTGTDLVTDRRGVLFYFTGLPRVPRIGSNRFLPGAVADHLTSVGGRMRVHADSVDDGDQYTVLDWLDRGVTASYGTAWEPCNITAKFPSPTVLLGHYLRGAPVIEAYWKSVMMPGEGNFAGEPLASPWRRDSLAWDAATRRLSGTTAAFVPGLVYAIESADRLDGPWTPTGEYVRVERPERRTVVIQPATAPLYRLRPI